MIFQPLDPKGDCKGVYADGALQFGEIPSGLTKTWSPASYLIGKDVKYASLFVGGASLRDICPEKHKQDYERVSGKMKAYLRSFVQSRVDLNELCFFDLVPQRFLVEYFESKNAITEHVFENFEKPVNYDFLARLSEIIHLIRYQKLNIDSSVLSSMGASLKGRRLLKSLRKVEPYISYNVFGTITGRLTTNKSSFPILTLPRESRGIIKPTNDYFVELDYNAAEIRVLLALNKISQPSGDIHDWIRSHIFNKSLTREESKKKTFAWLYNPEAKNIKLERVFNKEGLVSEYWKGEAVQTPFDRKIKADSAHSLNYLIQSTSSDLFLKQMIKVFDFLKDKRSHIAFCMHDSLTIDLHEDEKQILPALKRIFSDTELGEFKTNVSAGLHYGTMKKMNF